MYTVYFTYYIYNRITNQHYYGARWKTGCHPNDLWNTYFTSSKKVKQLIKEHGKESFDVQIRKIFDTREQCQLWEQKVLTKLKVKTREDWLNIAIGAPPTPKIGYKHKPETLIKMRKPKKEKWSEERKLAKSQDEKNKMANSKQMPSTKGYKHTAETIEKMKGRVAWNKGKKGVSVGWNKGLKKTNPNEPKITKTNSLGSNT